MAGLKKYIGVLMVMIQMLLPFMAHWRPNFMDSLPPPAWSISGFLHMRTGSVSAKLLDYSVGTPFTALTAAAMCYCLVFISVACFGPPVIL